MKRHQLEHIIRAAAGITGAAEVVIIGSQALLGQFPDAPPELLVSMEADLFSPRSPGDSDLMDGSIGRERLGTTPIADPQRELCLVRLQRLADIVS